MIIIFSAAHGVGVLGLEAPQGTVVDGHRVGTVGAVGGGHHPGVADDRATAPPATAAAAEAQTHDVGHLALGGGIAVGDTALNGTGSGSHDGILQGHRLRLLGKGGSRGNGHGQDS